MALMLVGPSKLSLTGVRIPTGWRQISGLFTSLVEDLTSGLEWTNLACGQGEELEASKLSGALTTRPPCHAAFWFVH